MGKVKAGKGLTEHGGIRVDRNDLDRSQISMVTFIYPSIITLTRWRDVRELFSRPCSCA